VVAIEQHIWLPFFKIVSEMRAGFPTLNHLGLSERGPSPLQVILILSFIHLRTPDTQYRQSALSYSLDPDGGPLAPQALKHIPRNIPN